MRAPYTLEQLTTLVNVVDEGSFSAAARKLGRVPSAVSYAIGQLEVAFGSTLFSRDGHTPVLTDAGRRLAGEARLVLSHAAELTAVAARLRDGDEPELRVVVDAIYPQDTLLDACAEFQRQFPSTMLRIEVGVLGEVVARVAAMNADLAACNLAGATPADLTMVQLGTVQLIPVCAPGHVLARAATPQSGTLLGSHVQLVHAERAEALSDDQGVLGNRTWRVTDLSLKRDLLLRGVGWGSLPAPLAIPLIASGQLIRLHPEPWPTHGHLLPLHAVTHRDKPPGRAGQWFRERLMLETARPSDAGGRRPAR